MESVVDRQTIPISNLFLNPLNDRHGELRSQPEVYAWILENLGEKIVTLAKDIADNGLNPIELLLVTPHKKPGLFVVWEGNRRLAALKFLNNPDLSPEPGYQRRFKQIADNASASIPAEVECVIAHDQRLIDRIISLKHTGENDGVGVVNWGPQANARFQARQGKPDRNAWAVQIYDYIKEANALDEATLRKLPVTTLQRLLNDPDVRAFLGLIVKDGALHSEIRSTELLKPLTKICGELSTGTIKVDDVKTKKKRTHYINRFDTNARPDLTQTLHYPHPIDAGFAPVKKGKKKSKTSKKSPHAVDRNYIIPEGTEWDFNSRREGQIFAELKNLRTEGFSNAVSTLFRVFFEMSVDYYIEKHHVTVSANDPLKKKSSKVIDHLEQQGLLTKSQARPMKQEVNSQHSIFSATRMNDYVHNPYAFPNPVSLNQTWNTFHPLLEKIWA